ncbi:MAG: undecaprenyldiphospho-muramoylpentapeptide beta-N-acetylglucosaminyltransferase [Propionibacteriaceae bacterium]|nr:undecaprenyldiphospho-muramoylpentapeptide beta-N-acetylglucosaminyltransferase [Propionibacteriaceae bacterium]
MALAGGGTMGHIAPLIATAEALRQVQPEVGLVGVGTARGLETRVAPQAGLDLELIEATPWPRRLDRRLVTLPPRLTKAVWQAARLLRRHRSEVVVGFGGYASLPVFLAARLLGLPLICHEANAVPGLANRVAARLGAGVAVTFANTGLPRQRVIGLPLRRAIVELDRAADRPAARRGFELPQSGRVLLVSGGSQGARRLNQAVIAARADLMAAGWSILHLTGAGNVDQAPSAEGDSTGPCYRPLAYADQMERAYAAADLMVGRSGAATVVELACVGLPALLVPLPHGNGEQAKNAADLVQAGGAVLVPDADFDAARLTGQLAELVAQPETLPAMARAGRDLMPRDGAQELARWALAAAAHQR